jgi:hypothetical protein
LNLAKKNRFKEWNLIQIEPKEPWGRFFWFFDHELGIVGGMTGGDRGDGSSGL